MRGFIPSLPRIYKILSLIRIVVFLKLFRKSSRSFDFSVQSYALPRLESEYVIRSKFRARERCFRERNPMGEMMNSDQTWEKIILEAWRPKPLFLHLWRLLWSKVTDFAFTLPCLFFLLCFAFCFAFLFKWSHHHHHSTNTQLPLTQHIYYTCTLRTSKSQQNHIY